MKTASSDPYCIFHTAAAARVQWTQTENIFNEFLDFIREERVKNNTMDSERWDEKKKQNVTARR